MSDKKALVTGCAGFVGHTLTRKLLDLGWDVLGVDSLTDFYAADLKRQNLEKLNDDRFSFAQVDITDLAADDAGIRDVTHVFHQAGQPGVRTSWGKEFREYTHANVDGTQALLELARGIQNLERFVYASSSSVYGMAERFPTQETDLPLPRSPYGVTKLAAEHLCGVYAANFGVPTVSLRYFTVYGPGQRPDMAFTRFLRGVYQGEPIEVYGDGHQVRDFTFVDDIVQANIMAAESKVAPGRVFNVAGGSSISVREVLNLIEGITSQTVRVDYGPPVEGDVVRTGGSTDAIQDALGWRPVVDIETGLRAHWLWTQSQNS